MPPAAGDTHHRRFHAQRKRRAGAEEKRGVAPERGVWADENTKRDT